MAASGLNPTHRVRYILEMNNQFIHIRLLFFLGGKKNYLL